MDDGGYQEILMLMRKTIDEFYYTYERPPAQLRVGITIKLILDISIGDEMSVFCGIPIHTYVELRYNQIQAIG